MPRSHSARIAISSFLGLVCAFLYFAGPGIQLPYWVPEVAYLGMVSAALALVALALGRISLWQVVAHSVPVTAVAVLLSRAVGGPVGPFIRPIAAVWFGALLVWAVSRYFLPGSGAQTNAK